MAVSIPRMDSHHGFEALARAALEAHFGVLLAARSVLVGDSVAKSFDLVSGDGRVVGEAKWSKRLPTGNPTPATRATISEDVWLLQRVDAERVFLIFGNDPAVPEDYLRRYGPLVAPVEFIVLDGGGLRWLTPAPADVRGQDDAVLIERHVESDPNHPGLGDVRLVESGVAVWAVIGYLGSVDGDVNRAASAYDLTPEEMAAALAYYRRHRGAIDARLSANAGGRLVTTAIPA